MKKTISIILVELLKVSITLRKRWCNNNVVNSFELSNNFHANFEWNQRHQISISLLIYILTLP